MPAAVPVVATIAAGVAAANEMYAIAMVITVAAQIATQALTKTPSLNSYRDTSERKQVLRAAASAKTVVYGRTTTAGTLFFSEEQAGEQDDGEMLHLAIALADIRYPVFRLSGWVMSRSVAILSMPFSSCTPTARRRTLTCWRTARHGKRT